MITTLITSGAIFTGAYWITKYKKKSGIKLWIYGYCWPIIVALVELLIFLLLQDKQTCQHLMIFIISKIALCMLLCRILLQWTTSIWRKNILSEKRMKFWKRYIQIEGFLVGMVGMFFISSIQKSIHFVTFPNNEHLPIAFLLIISVIYKYQIQKKNLPKLACVYKKIYQ